MGFTHVGAWSSESSNVRKGQVFYEDYQKETSTNSNTSTTSSSSYSNSISVLIVDDDIASRKLNELLLSLNRLDVQGVDNGQQAIDLHCDGKTFNLILMDIDMPIKNGFQTTKELRDMGVYCAIVGLTPVDEDEDVINNFLKVGLDGCIRKPLTLEKISPFLTENPNIDYVNDEDDSDDDDGDDMDGDQSIISSCNSN